MCTLFQTAERITMDQTALRPASVRTEHNAIDGMAAAAACTAGSDSPVRKVQKWLTRMHPCCVNHLPSSLHLHGQQVTSFADSGVRAEVTFWLTPWNKSKWLVSVLTAFTYCLHMGQNCGDCAFFGVVFVLIEYGCCAFAELGSLCAFPQVDIRASPITAAAAEET